MEIITDAGPPFFNKALTSSKGVCVVSHLMQIAPLACHQTRALKDSITFKVSGGMPMLKRRKFEEDELLAHAERSQREN